ncbi:hypothetical protein C0389_00355 [bacterium]|nr:hypothetical protein [bacterium]
MALDDAKRKILKKVGISQKQNIFQSQRIFMSKLENDLIEALLKNDVINERLMRDFQIRKRYKYLREVEKLKGKEARLKLVDEFMTGEKNIEDILYSRKRIEV